tara:strand:+ start:1803 stop:1982 length:180 start_codon:yes stop_codon:yes gene_type:complete
LAIEKLTIGGKLVSTWHTTLRNNIKHLKNTQQFLMPYDGEDNATNPQVEEGIIGCRWVR